MKRTVTTLLTILLLFLTVKSVHADIYVQVKVNDDNSVNLNFKITNINSTVYNQAKENFDETTIIKAINASTGTLIEKYDGTVKFDDETHSINVSYSFFNYIVEEEINKEKNLRIFKVNTAWRFFNLNLTKNYSINFAEIFALSASEWGKTENGYIYNSTSNFGRTIFEVIGPETSINSYVNGEIVTFEAPLSKFDLFISSPYIVLLIVILVVFIAFAYRKLRYGRVL